MSRKLVIVEANMFGYKSASQSFKTKMGHGSSLCAIYLERIVKQLKKITFLNARLQRMYPFHHLPYIILSQDSGNPEKSQSVLGKAVDLCRPLLNVTDL